MTSLEFFIGGWIGSLLAAAFLLPLLQPPLLFSSNSRQTRQDLKSKKPRPPPPPAGLISISPSPLNHAPSALRPLVDFKPHESSYNSPSRPVAGGCTPSRLLPPVPMAVHRLSHPLPINSSPHLPPAHQLLKPNSPPIPPPPLTFPIHPHHHRTYPSRTTHHNNTNPIHHPRTARDL